MDNLIQKYSEEEQDLKTEYPKTPDQCYERVYIGSDGDNDYVIPYKLKDKFHELVGKEDWDEFDTLFSKYLCSGDPMTEHEYYIQRS